MKKILAIALMTTSIGVMASPAQCLLDYVDHHGGNTKYHDFKIPQWDYNNNHQGEFKYNIQALIIGYLIKVKANWHDKVADEGPNHCGCTVFEDPERTTPTMEALIGICGRL